MTAQPIYSGQKGQKTSAEYKKLARLSPAYEAYRGWISRYLGLHMLAVGDWASFLVSFFLVGGSAALFVLANFENVINPNHARHCCYPPGAIRGSLGSCTDSNAVVHSVATKVECPVVGILALVFYAVGGALLAVNYVFMRSTEARFFREAARELDRLKAFVQTEKQLCNKKNKPPPSEYMLVRKWIGKHNGLFRVVLLPESFLFASHLRILGRPFLFVTYNFLLWGGGLFAALFFSTALPLDAAWRCYPNPTLTATSLGRCDKNHTQAARRFHVRANVHTEFFWIAFGVWVCAHVLVVAIYGYTVFEFKRLYAKHILTKFSKLS